VKESYEKRIHDVIDKVANLFRRINLVALPEPRERTQVTLQSKDVKYMSKDLQKFIGKIHAENQKLKAENEELIERLYEDKVLNIKKDLSDQIKSIAREVILEGELHLMQGYPKAISYGSDNRVMGRLLGISHYNGLWYPLLWKKDGIRVITQPADTYDEAIRAKADDYVILGYDARGKYVPKVYMQT